MNANTKVSNFKIYCILLITFRKKYDILITVVLQVKRKSKIFKNISSKTSLGVRKIKCEEKTLLCNKGKAMFFLVYI